MKDIKYADLQINGFMGVDFAAPDLTEEQFLRTAEYIFNSGTYLFLPTIVTSSKDVYLRNLSIMQRAAETHGWLDRIPGAHLEGPFISPKPGAVGAHIPEYVLEADTGFFDEILDRSNGFVKLLTVAAEKDNMAQFIAHAVSRGVTVSCGHQLASFDDLNNAASAGAKLITHLGNGCPNMLDRHHNIIWSGMACDGLSAISWSVSLQEIGDGAFWGCSHLTKLVLPSPNIIFGTAVFRGCQQLNEVLIFKDPDHWGPIGGTSDRREDDEYESRIEQLMKCLDLPNF